jgi:hypothetical protein
MTRRPKTDIDEFGRIYIVRCWRCGRGPYDTIAMSAEGACAECALAAAASGGDVKQAPGEAPQSGLPKEGNAQ